ncbi:ParA family protein [Streptomyces yangpuensis]
MNKKHLPQTTRELRCLMASIEAIKQWIKERHTLVVGCGVLKGGTGKSTTILYLALWFAWSLGLKVGVIDTDNNSQSLGNWCRAHAALGEKIPFELIEHNPKDPNGPTLEKRIKQLRGSFDVLLVDLGGGDRETFTDFCILGDLLLMPSAPSGWETSRIQATLQTAARAARLNEHGLTVYMFFVKCNFQTTLPEEQRAVLETDLSEIDEDFIPVPLVHPYFDISGTPHYVRSHEVIPRRSQLHEFGELMRHAMVEIMKVEEAA